MFSKFLTIAIVTFLTACSMQSTKPPPPLATSEFTPLTPTAGEMVPCKGWKGLVDKREQTVLLGIQDLINLLSDCAKSHGLLIQDVNDYNKKGGK